MYKDSAVASTPKNRILRKELAEMSKEGLEPSGADHIHILDLKYLTVPQRYLRDQNLSANQEKLLSGIELLSQKEGFCWAKNKTLAYFMKITKGSIINMLTKLKKEGYIKQEWNGQQRRIYLVK
ncbi:hypothetical protein LCGC14_2858470 [marine sediment metagenome]|uniref:HTH marR-type domain-containing protein n=1 Tax=marine sediment metagenome TaxID=412755 RepID=A0A0F8YT67_9ZZZZ